MKHSKARQEQKAAEPQDEFVDFALGFDMSQLKADFLMESVEGQLALRVIYWFILSHQVMLENIITGSVNHNKKQGGKSQPPSKAKQVAPLITQSKSLPEIAKLYTTLLKIVPRIRTNFGPTNIIHDFHFVNKLRTFDEVN